MRVRYRIDGVLRDATRSRGGWSRGVVSRIKIMAEPRHRRAPRRRRTAASSLAIDGRKRRRPRRDAAARRRRGGRACASSTRSGGVDRASTRLGMRRLERARFEHAFAQAVRRDPRHRPDRLGQDHDALRRAAGRCNTPRAARSSRSRTRSSTELDGIKQMQVNPQGRPDLRRRPALDDARRPGRDHGRRDPRPRDGADRGRGRADRPPRPLHAAHERRADRDHPPDRHGHRAVPGRLRRSTASSPSAWRARSAPVLQGAVACHGEVLRADGFDVDRRHRRLRAGRLRALRRHRLQGPDRHLRGHADQRGDPPARRSPGRPSDEIAAARRRQGHASGCARTAWPRSCRA